MSSYWCRTGNGRAKRKLHFCLSSQNGLSLTHNSPVEKMLLHLYCFTLCLEKQGGRKVLYHLSLEKIKFCKIQLVACEIPHVRGWMGLDYAFLWVQDPKCCPGKLGKPAWVLTKVYPEISLSPTQSGLSVPAERDPSHSCSVFLLLGGLEPFPDKRNLFLCGSSLAIQRVSATWAGADLAPAALRYSFVCFYAAGQQLPPFITQTQCHWLSGTFCCRSYSAIGHVLCEPFHS